MRSPAHAGLLSSIVCADTDHGLSIPLYDSFGLGDQEEEGRARVFTLPAQLFL